MPWVPSGPLQSSLSYGRGPGGQLRQMLGPPPQGRACCASPVCLLWGSLAAMLTIGQQCRGARWHWVSPWGRDSSGRSPQVRCCPDTPRLTAPRCPPDSTPQPLPCVDLVMTQWTG